MVKLLPRDIIIIIFFSVFSGVTPNSIAPRGLNAQFRQCANLQTEVCLKHFNTDITTSTN